MKIHRLDLSRRGLIKRAAIVLSLAPLARLSTALARAEQRRRHHEGAHPGEIWIGHC